MTSIAVRPGSQLKLGGLVWFDVADVPRTKNPPRIEILAYAKTNGQLVYGEARDVTQMPFTLGGSSSVWVWNPMDVHCIANLYWWSFHPTETYNFLASCSFDASAG